MSTLTNLAHLICTAVMRGVVPLLFAAFTFDPDYSNINAISNIRWRTAIIRGVLPSASGVTQLFGTFYKNCFTT